MGRSWTPRFLAGVGAVVVVDQLTKSLAAHRGLVAGNPGYALGVIGGPAAALVAGTAVVMVVFVGVVVPRAAALGVSPLTPALIVGGTLGNALDRITIGAARDFLTTPLAIVNLADVAVTTGIIAFSVAMMWRLRIPRHRVSGR